MEGLWACLVKILSKELETVCLLREEIPDWVRQKLGVSKLYKKGKSQIRHWETKLDQSQGKFQNTKEESKQAQSPERILLNVCPAAISTDFVIGPQLMAFHQDGMHFEKLFQKLWWIFSYPQRREFTFINTELEAAYTWIISRRFVLTKTFFFSFLKHSVYISQPLLLLRLAVILSYGQWGLGKSDAFPSPVPAHKNFP